MSIVANDLRDEILDEFAGLPAEASSTQVVQAVSNAIATVFNASEGLTVQTWVPVLEIGTVPVGGSYTEQQGVYWEAADLVIVACKVKKTSVSTSGSQSVRIAGLPYSSGSQLAHWPTAMPQSSLLSGDAYARFASGLSHIHINEDQREGISGWTFSGHTFFATIGAIYVKA